MSDKEKKNALVFSSFFRQIKNSEKKISFYGKNTKKNREIGVFWLGFLIVACYIIEIFVHF